MNQQLCMIVCGNFEREARALSGHPDFREVKFLPLSVSCDQIEAEWRGLEKTIKSCQDEGNLVCLIGSFCLTQASQEIRLKDSCQPAQKGQCCEWLVDRDVLDRFFQEGAYLLMPGWLKNWEDHVEEKWGGHRKTAQSFFRNSAKKLVLLDTGLYPKIDGALASFAKFLRLPCEVYPAGLGYFRMSLSQLVLEWKLREGHLVVEKKIEKIKERMSGYSRIGHLLGSVAKARNEEESISTATDLFHTLFHPEKVDFKPFPDLTKISQSEGSPYDRILSLNADYSWTADKKTLLLKVAHAREIFGIFEITGFVFPDQKEEALDIGITLAKVTGLSFSNNRISQAFQEAKEKTRAVEAALKTSEEKMQSVYESVPVGIYRTTSSGQIIDANQKLAGMLGFPDVASLKAVNSRELHLNPADRDLWYSLVESNGFVENFETQLRHRDGTIIWVNDKAQAVKDGRGHVVCIDGILEDITKKKQTESQLSWNWKIRAVIAEVSKRLLSPTSIEEMSTLILDHARRLTGSQTCFVGFVDPHTGTLVPAAVTADAKELLKKHPEMSEKAHSSSDLWGWVQKGKKPILTNVPNLDPRYSGMPDWHFPVNQFLSAPAVMSGNLVGLIALANADKTYSEQDLDVVQRLAELYAIAVHRARTEDELRDLSLEDELTKLKNRRGFLTLAEQQLKIANRTMKEMYLLYADLDDLKVINDTFGHGEGDKAIVATAEVLREAFRESDIIARIGGDEFVVLAIDAQEGKPDALTRRMKENVEAWNVRNGQKFTLSLSLGIASYNPEEPCSIQRLLCVADKAMYREKSAKKSLPLAA